MADLPESLTPEEKHVLVGADERGGVTGPFGTGRTSLVARGMADARTGRLTEAGWEARVAVGGQPRTAESPLDGFTVGLGATLDCECGWVSTRTGLSELVVEALKHRRGGWCSAAPVDMSRRSEDPLKACLAWLARLS